MGEVATCMWNLLLILVIGLSAPVPRGRKGKKVKKDVVKKAQFDEDLTKLDIDVDTILIDEGYKKHLKRQSNK